MHNPPETRFGGDFATPTDWQDPFIAEQFGEARQLDALHAQPATRPRRPTTSRRRRTPRRPSAQNWLGTDERRARHGGAAALRLSRQHPVRARADARSGTAIGIAAGALQGYFGGRIDLGLQRVIEIWSAIPELYLLIIFASIFEPSLLLLLVLLSLFGWIGLSDYVRAEFLRNRSLEFVQGGARAGPVEPCRSSGATCCRTR